MEASKSAMHEHIVDLTHKDEEQPPGRKRTRTPQHETKTKKSQIVKEELGRAKDEQIVDLTVKKEETETIRELRDVWPAHYLFKIKNFSLLLSNPKFVHFESTNFEVGGYKWQLCVYPKGKNENNKHISLYLVLSESNSIPLHKEVNGYFKLFLYNQILDKYLTVQDAKGRISRFRGMKTDFGFDQFLPLDEFNDASNGYLVDDCCFFGAEVFVVEPVSKGECASVLNYLSNNTYTWNVLNFAERTTEEYCESEVFSIGGYKWTLRLYPNGNEEQKGKSLSLFLVLEEEALDPRHTLSVYFDMYVKDQLHGKHHDASLSEKAGNYFCQFSRSTDMEWGYSELISLDKLNDLSEGYLVDDAIVLEVKISAITMIKEFS
ncbi:TRAF-like family protein [Euphorbia peplus]|nr:TRAF-like family protein [Euphorbia peplus]